MNYINGTPAIWKDEVVVFGGCDAQLYMVSLADGKLIRQVDLEAPIASSANTRSLHMSVIWTKQFMQSI